MDRHHTDPAGSQKHLALRISTKPLPPENERTAAANERADTTEAENRNLRGRIADLERQLEERGYRRRRRRSNNPPEE